MLAVGLRRRRNRRYAGRAVWIKSKYINEILVVVRLLFFEGLARSRSIISIQKDACRHREKFSFVGHKVSFSGIELSIFRTIVMQQNARVFKSSRHYAVMVSMEQLMKHGGPFCIRGRGAEHDKDEPL